jgi:predicted house-cleaning noncanonical NTP pyrophosphatase (MazG superfamily)
MTEEQRVQAGDILRYYGEEHQQKKAIEEMAELITAIMHGDRKNYVEELADVQVMIEQLYQALSFEEKQTFIITIHDKITRQLMRISDKEENEDE